MMGDLLVRHDVTSASLVRRELTLDLDMHNVDEESIDQVALVASELVGNALRHASSSASSSSSAGTLTVSWAFDDDGVIFCVEDRSTEIPVPRIATPDAPNGRGLKIIQALSEEWGYELTPVGKRVWARIAIHQAA